MIPLLALGALVLTGLLVAAVAYRPRILGRAGARENGTRLAPPAMCIFVGNLVVVATSNDVVTLCGLVVFLGGVVWLIATVRARRAG